MSTLKSFYSKRENEINFFFVLQDGLSFLREILLVWNEVLFSFGTFVTIKNRVQ